MTENGVWGLDNLPTPHRVQAADFSCGETEIFVLRGVARKNKASLLQDPGFIYGGVPFTPHPALAPGGRLTLC